MEKVRQSIGGLGNIMFKNAYIWAKFRNGEIPDIYVQSDKYWKEYAEEIRSMYGKNIGYDDRIALHIRRGDYLKAAQFHTNLWDTDYYRNAVALFPGEKFLIFCKDSQNPVQDAEDYEWCKENIPSLGIEFEMHQHGEETDDFNAMASCKGIIMANSSFSWWASYLGDPHKKVVCPKEYTWFTDKVIRTECPDNWTKI